MPPEEPQNQNDWIRKTFSDEFNTQNYDKLKRFTKPDDLGKSYFELETKLSSTGRLPKEDAPKEEWDSFYKNWGRPESAEKFVTPEVPKEVGELDPAFLKSLSEEAHAMGLNQKQYDHLLKWGFGKSIEMQTATRTASETQIGTLKKEWGSDYDSRCNFAAATVKSLCSNTNNEFVSFLEQTKMGDDPRFIKFFYNLGKQIGEDEILAGDEGAHATSESAKEKIAEIRGNKDHPFNNPKHPQHKTAVAEVEELYKQATGEAQI